jgi:hypothetical protein
VEREHERGKTKKGASTGVCGTGVELRVKETKTQTCEQRAGSESGINSITCAHSTHYSFFNEMVEMQCNRQVVHSCIRLLCIVQSCMIDRGFYECIYIHFDEILVN